MTPATGIDTSHYQPGDITAALKGCTFAIGQASVGVWSDPTYTIHTTECVKAGVVAAAYHYVVPGPGDGRQAAVFLTAAGPRAQFLAIDHEGPALRYPTLTRGIIANVRRLDKLHRKIGLYCSNDNYPGDLGQDFNWIADYATVPSVAWEFWQKSGSGIDHDVFAGTVAQFTAWLKGS